MIPRLLRPKNAIFATVLSLVAANAALAGDPADSACMRDYRKLRNTYAVKVALVPLAGMALFAGNAIAAFSMEYGSLAPLRAGPLGLVVEGAIQFAFPVANVISTVGIETYEIVRLTQTKRALALLRDVHGIGNGKRLRKFTAQVQEEHPEMTEEMIRERILTADRSGDLCNGNWVSKKHRNMRRRANRVALLKDIRKKIEQGN